MNVSQAQKGRTYLVKKVNLEGNIERRLEMLGMTDQVKLMVLNKKNQDASDHQYCGSSSNRNLGIIKMHGK